MTNICTINLNEGEGRQTIMWNSIDGKLYTSTDPSAEPMEVDGYTYATLAEAVDAADAMWGSSDIAGAWELDWIEEDD